VQGERHRAQGEGIEGGRALKDGRWEVEKMGRRERCRAGRMGEGEGGINWDGLDVGSVRFVLVKYASQPGVSTIPYS